MARMSSDGVASLDIRSVHNDLQAGLEVGNPRILSAERGIIASAYQSNIVSGPMSIAGLMQSFRGAKIRENTFPSKAQKQNLVKRQRESLRIAHALRKVLPSRPPQNLY